MQTQTEIRELLAARGLAPRKALGQHFLVDHNLLARLVDAAGVGEGDLVLEVGPGTGTLTEELLARGSRVVAAELDPGLARLLRDRMGDERRFTLVEGDCLESKRRLATPLLEALGDQPFAVVANLPYGCATPLMLTLLVDHPACRGLFVTVQREVADRLLAQPGTRDYGPLAVVARVTARCERLASLPPHCFWPRPEVESAMVAIRRLPRPGVNDLRGFAEFCSRLFGQRRKQLGAVLGDRDAWPEGVTRRARAEDLSLHQLIALWQQTPAHDR